MGVFFEKRLFGVSRYNLSMVLAMVSAPSPYFNGGGGDLILKFAKILWWQNFFLDFWVINLHGGVKIIWGE